MNLCNRWVVAALAAGGLLAGLGCQTHPDYYASESQTGVVRGDDGIDEYYERGKRYTESDFNRIIEIKEREAHRVKLFMEMIHQHEKTLVFCATQDHALAVRDLINQTKTSPDPHYCERVTANDGELGE